MLILCGNMEWIPCTAKYHQFRDFDHTSYGNKDEMAGQVMIGSSRVFGAVLES